MPEDLKQTIEGVLKNLQGRETDLFEISLQALSNKLTSKEAELVKVDRINKGVLYLKVKSPLVLIPLRFKKQSILKEIKKHTDIIQDIKFKIGE